MLSIQKLTGELGYSVSVTEAEFSDAGWPSDPKTKPAFEVYKVINNQDDTLTGISMILTHDYEHRVYSSVI